MKAYYIVSIGLNDFNFTNGEEAIIFATTAKQTVTEDVNVFVAVDLKENDDE